MIKKIFTVFCLLIFVCPAFAGITQQQYEKSHAFNLQKVNKSNMYEKLMKLYYKSDEADFPALSKIKNNFEKCTNTGCWQYVEIDDYTYKWLNNDVKDIILYNNLIYKNK